MADVMMEKDELAKVNAKRWYDQKSRERTFKIGDSVLVLMPTGKAGWTPTFKDPTSSQSRLHH